MWTWTAYILWKLYQVGKKEISFDELRNFIFGELWRKHGLILNESSRELYKELEFMDRLGAIEFDGDIVRVRCPHKLEKLGRIVEESSLRDVVSFYGRYIRTIGEAVKKYGE